MMRYEIASHTKFQITLNCFYENFVLIIWNSLDTEIAVIVEMYLQRMLKFTLMEDKNLSFSDVLQNAGVEVENQGFIKFDFESMCLSIFWFHTNTMKLLLPRKISMECFFWIIPE